MAARRHMNYEEEKKVGEGTYGNVFCAREKHDLRTRVALKQFKVPRSGEGIPVTAYREIALLRELQYNPHPNIVGLRDAFLDPSDKSLWMVLDFAQHDLCRIVNFHDKHLKTCLPSPHLVKSVVYQLLQGIHHLHTHFIMHRDLKPANILLTSNGRIQIADFGLARIFASPLRSLKEDGIVVTIWYRAPELLLGSPHYTPAIDLWAVGCIFAELITAKALFPGAEEKGIPFQQLERIFSVLGMPTPSVAPTLTSLPSWSTVCHRLGHIPVREAMRIPPLSDIRLRTTACGYNLLMRLLDMDPKTRITAADALKHPFFHEEHPLVDTDALRDTGGVRYPPRVNDVPVQGQYDQRLNKKKRVE